MSIIVVFKCIWEAQGLFSKIVFGNIVCEREENILVNVEAGAPGPTYVAFSSPQVLILFFVENRKRAGAGERLKHMD